MQNGQSAFLAQPRLTARAYLNTQKYGLFCSLVTIDCNRTHYSDFSVLNGTLQFALSLEEESPYIYSKFNALKYGHPIKTDTFYGPLSVCINRV